MSTLSTLVVKLVGDTGGFRSSIDETSTMLRKAGDSMGAVGQNLTTKVTLPIIGIGAAATVMSNQFNAGMANVVSLVPEAASEIIGMKGSVQDLAIEVGKGTGDMTSGLYQTVSAFGYSAEAVEILRVNAIAASGGLATVRESIDLTSAVTKGYGDTTVEAVQHTADLAMKTVSLGQTTFPELAGSMGRVVPIAANLNVAQEELFATMATATGVTGSASEVSTQMRGTLQSLMAPTATMSGLMQQLGYSNGEAMIKSLGFQGTLAAIVSSAEASGAPLQQYIGSIEGQTLALALAGPQADTYKAKLTEMGNAAGAAQAAFEAQTQGANAAGFAWEQAAIKAQVMGQKLGDALGPAILLVLQRLDPLLAVVQGLIDKFMALDPKTQMIIFGALGLVAAIGPVLMILGPLVSGFGVLIAVLGALVSPVGLVIAAIVALGIVIATNKEFLSTTLSQIKVLFENTFNQISAIVQQVLGIIRGSVTSHASEIKAQFTQAYNSIRAIVESVLAAIMSIVSGVLSNIKTFLDAHGAEIQQVLGDAWVAIGRIINVALEIIQATIVPILQGIAQFIQSHGAEIQQILSGAWTIIKNVIEGVLALIEGILRVALAVIKGDWSGALEIVKSTAEKVWGNIKGIIGGALEIIQTLVGKTLDQIKTWFVDRWNEIISFLRGINLADIGASIIQGLIDGIKSAAQALIDAAVGVVNDAINAAKRLLGIASPSTVFIQIAVDMILGLIKGLQSMKPEAVAAMSDALSAVLDAVAKALETFASLAELPEIEDLQARLNRLADYIKAVVEQMRILAGYFANPARGIGSAKAVADALQPIIDAVTGFVDAMTAIGDLELVEDFSTKLAAFVDFLRTNLPLIVAALAAAATQFKGPAMLAAAAFAETAGVIVAPFKILVDGLTALAAWVPASIDPVLGLFFLNLRRITRSWIAAAALFDKDALAGATAFADAATKLAAPLSAMANGFAAVAAWVPASIDPVLGLFFLNLRRIARSWIAAAVLFDKDALAGATAFADAATKLVAPLRAMADGFAAVAAWVPAYIDPVLGFFFLNLRRLTRSWIAAAALFDKDALAGATAFADAATKLVAPLRAMADGFAAVAAWVPAYIDPLLGLFFLNLRRLTRSWIAAAALFDKDVLAGATAFADAAAKLVAPLSAMVEAFTVVASYVAVDISAQVTVLITQLEIVAGLMITAAGQFDDKLVAAAAVFAEAASKIVSPLRSMVEAFEAVAGYALGFVDITIPFATLISHLQQLVPLMIAAAGQFDPKAAEAAATFAETAGKIVSPLRSMVEAFEAVADFDVPPDIALPFGALVDALRQLAVAMIAALPGLDQKLVDAAAAFAESAGKIVTVVKPGIDAIREIAAYQTTAGLLEAVRMFGADLVILAGALRAALSGVTEATLDLYDDAIAFGERIGRLVAVIRPGLDALAGIASYARGTGNLRTATETFVADLLVVAEALRIGLAAPAQAILDAYDAARSFAERIAALIGFIRPALDVLREIERYSGAGNLQTGISNFLRHIEGLINALATTFAAMGPDVVRSAGEFSELIRAIVTNMTGAMRDLASLGNVQDLVDSAFGVGAGWIDGLIGGLNSRLSDLVALMAYIRGLFPSSPAQYGAWRTLPDGAAVGQQFTGEMAGAVERGAAGVNSAMSRLHGAMAGSGTSGRGQGAGGGGMAVTINFQQPVVIREDADIERLAQAVGDVFARQASTNRRMTPAWATAS